MAGEVKTPSEAKTEFGGKIQSEKNKQRVALPGTSWKKSVYILYLGKTLNETFKGTLSVFCNINDFGVYMDV